jgi:ABC-type glycerol-3-phosphate transport system substrate-binding protein
MKKFALLIAVVIALTGCSGGGTSSTEESFFSGDGNAI